MSRTPSPALPRSPISRAAVVMRYSRRFWPSPSRRTAGFLGDIAPECNEHGGGGEDGRVPEQHQAAAPLREQPGCRDGGPVERLAGVERQPAREPRSDELPGDALDQGDPGQRQGGGPGDVADERAKADADECEGAVGGDPAGDGLPGADRREMEGPAPGRPPGGGGGKGGGGGDKPGGCADQPVDGQLRGDDPPPAGEAEEGVGDRAVPVLARDGQD